jgi:carboxyl-terminal processing protease
MNKLLAFLILLTVFTSSTQAQQRQFCHQIELVNNLIQEHHINPKPINDSLSVKVWNNFIDALDPEKRYLLKSDLAELKEDKYMLDDFFRKKKCKFIYQYSKIFEKRLDETRDILESFYKEDFIYHTTDSLYFDATRKREFSENPEDKISDWRRAMKYETVTEAIKRFDNKKDFLMAFDSLKPKVKTFVIDRAICAIDEIKQHQNGFEHYVQELFLNALSTVYDPHTIYFNNAEKNAFDSAYSSNSLSFGISVEKNDRGQIVVAYVNANSPAALENKIEAGDILRSLKANRKTLFVSCISDQEVINFLSEESHNTIEFEVEKSRGQIKTVTLTKTIIPMEFNAVDAFVIAEDIKAGYVNIPSFYVNSESGDWRGTSLDMGKALYKLLQENIDGLLIDLRQNGGGSMKEAIDLANLFVDGPFAILKQSDQKITIFNDKTAPLFNKPIVILVDAYTASAAELFAGVMQDYKKAVIVGDHTYGKATSQNIFPLDYEDESLGFLKITSEKFYRISGKSHQKKGIQPDIYLANLLNGIASREIDYKHVLKADTLQVSENIDAFKLPVEQLDSLSRKRQHKSEAFQYISEANKKLKYLTLEKKDTYAFLPENIYDDFVIFDKIFEDISAFFEDRTFINLNYTKHDQDAESTKDNKRLEMIKSFVSKDLMVLESYRILKDFIKIQSP